MRTGECPAINILFNSIKFKTRAGGQLEEERSRAIGGVANRLNQIDRRMIEIQAELVGLQETISYAQFVPQSMAEFLMPKFHPRWWSMQISLFLS